MRLLSELHGEGLTVVMVTHDPVYAKMAERSVYMEDGAIVPVA